MRLDMAMVLRLCSLLEQRFVMLDSLVICCWVFLFGFLFTFATGKTGFLQKVSQPFFALYSVIASKSDIADSSIWQVMCSIFVRM